MTTILVYKSIVKSSVRQEFLIQRNPCLLLLTTTACLLERLDTEVMLQGFPAKSLWFLGVTQHELIT